MSKQLLISAVAASALLAATAGASEIYRYTDDDGNVVYVDRPSGDSPAERVVNIQSRPTDVAALQARAQARAATQETAEERRQARAEEKAAKEAEKAAAQERADRCQIARNRMETLVTSRALFRQDENGERTYLEEEEIMEARAKVQAQIEETCD